MNLHAIKTICGNLYETLLSEKNSEIAANDLEMLLGYLTVSPASVYCIEVNDDGFIFSTKESSFHYRHHALQEERLIDVM